MIALIALIPALIVYAAAYFSKNLFITILTAVIMALIGVFTGNPIYILANVMFVWIGYLLSQEHIKYHEKEIKEQTSGCWIRSFSNSTTPDGEPLGVELGDPELAFDAADVGVTCSVVEEFPGVFWSAGAVPLASVLGRIVRRDMAEAA